jgi:hypothetical protein
MTADKCDKDNPKTGAKAEHETKETEYPGRRWTMLDILAYICGVLALVGSLWLGFLGVSGSLRDQRIWALWVLYGTLLLILTGAFLYFHQNVRKAIEQERKAADGTSQSRTPTQERPIVIVAACQLDDLEPGKIPRLRIRFQNVGNALAETLEIKTQTLFGTADEPPDPLVYKDVPPGGSAPLGSGDSAFVNVSLPELEPFVDRIKTDIIHFWFYGEARYTANGITENPWTQFCFRYDHAAGGFKPYRKYNEVH